MGNVKLQGGMIPFGQISLLHLEPFVFSAADLAACHSEGVINPTPTLPPGQFPVQKHKGRVVVGPNIFLVCFFLKVRLRYLNIQAQQIKTRKLAAILDQ